MKRNREPDASGVMEGEGWLTCFFPESIDGLQYLGMLDESGFNAMFSREV